MSNSMKSNVSAGSKMVASREGTRKPIIEETKKSTVVPSYP
jgi:hypothetical protein